MDRSSQNIYKEGQSLIPTQTEVIESDNLVPASQPILRLQLQKPKTDKKVKWRNGVVDNEEMGKKKSKCCCIYKKPRAYDESSSDSDDDCENCFGHVEKRKKKSSSNENSSDIESSSDSKPDSTYCTENEPKHKSYKES